MDPANGDLASTYDFSWPIFGARPMIIGIGKLKGLILVVDGILIIKSHFYIIWSPLANFTIKVRVYQLHLKLLK